MMDKIVFPRRIKGEMTNKEWINQKKQFGADLQALELKMLGADSVKDGVPENLKTSTRGWCYLLENFGAINKDEFIIADTMIGECREKGYLPIDFVALDKAREWINVEPLKKEYKDPKEWIKKILNDSKELYKHKNDIAFWEVQKYYIQLRTEKIDTYNLFKPICGYFHIPIANARGWPDINSWNLMAQRYKQAEEMGLIPVLLWHGDYDPVGILIPDKIMNILKRLENATGWNPDNLKVDVFGLSLKFIEDNDLLWIDNLITGSGRNLGELYERYKAGTLGKTKFDKYEIEYIKKNGVRKCEANAVMTVRKAAQVDCYEAIIKYLEEDGKDPFKEYNKKLKEDREKAKEVLDSIGYEEKITEMIENLEKL